MFDVIAGVCDVKHFRGADYVGKYKWPAEQLAKACEYFRADFEEKLE